MFTYAKKKNAEILYTYAPNLNNRKLLDTYGFIFDDNKCQYYVMEITLSKMILTANKFMIANEANKLIDPFFEQESTYYDSKLSIFNYPAFLSPTKRNIVLLNLLKMNIISQTYDLNIALQSLIENKWLYYDLEVSSRALVILRLTNFVNIKTTKVADILFLLQGTKNYMSHFNDDPKLNFNYNLKRLYLIVDKEEQLILIKHKKYNIEDIGKIVMDQFFKIKNHLVNN